MSKIVGVTVGTPLSPRSIKEKLQIVTSVNGTKPDAEGNVEIPKGATSWNDLTDKPSIPTKLSELENDSGYALSTDIPTVPTKLSEMENDSGFITAEDIPEPGASSWNDLTDKPFGTEQAFEPIVWDGNTEGLEFVDFGSLVGGDELLLYKIAEPTEPLEVYDGANITALWVSSVDGEKKTVPLEKYDEITNCSLFQGTVTLRDDSESEVWGQIIVVGVVTGENELGLPVGVYCSGVLESGHTLFISPVTISKESIKTLDEKYLPDSVKGGSAPAIIDVVELPTENIDENSFYRLLTGTFVFNQYTYNGYTVYCVDGLPEVGEPASDAAMTTITSYYNTQDGVVYCYIDELLSYGLGIPVGWYEFGMLMAAFGASYGGVITDILDDPIDDTLRLLLEYVVHSYKDGKWTSHKTIGWAGNGTSAEVFNHPSNKAYGTASHAEGRETQAGEFGKESYGSHAEGCGTHASGDGSHAEGSATSATGLASHAEGADTSATGYAAHAEGHLCFAPGAASHAEGTETRASGNDSHTEGLFTVANGTQCHAQGRYNIIEDIPGDPHVNSGKYAHIVGNGTGEQNRSNAHTLDWNGLGWFAGGLKVGGTGQDDENAKEVVLTVNGQTPDENGNVVVEAGGAASVPDEDMIELLMEMDIVQPVFNTNGDLFTDTNNKVYVL